MTRWRGGFSILLAALGCCQVAGAQDEQNQVTVAVPGLRAIDGDDGVANELTGWLRAGASAVEGWQLHTAAVSLEQFMIVHRCEAADEDCLSKIAEGIVADRLISGSVSRVPAKDGDGYDFEAELFYFDASTGEIEKTSTLRFPKSQSTPQELAVMGQIEVQALADAPLDELGKEQALNLILSREPELGLHQSTLDLLTERHEGVPRLACSAQLHGNARVSRPVGLELEHHPERRERPCLRARALARRPGGERCLCRGQQLGS